MYVHVEITCVHTSICNVSDEQLNTYRIDIRNTDMHIHGCTCLCAHGLCHNSTLYGNFMNVPLGPTASDHLQLAVMLIVLIVFKDCGRSFLARRIISNRLHSNTIFKNRLATRQCLRKLP